MEGWDKMKLYAFNTENRHNQYLIFTSKKALFEWAHAVTRLTDPEILALTKELNQTGNHYNFFA